VIVSERPLVAVVVPTLGRVKMVAELLKSVQQVSHCDDIKVEVLLIDSSPADEQIQLHELCKNFEAILIEGPVSVSEKRNLGIMRARAEYVFLVDSDCTLTSGCLRAHITTLQQCGAQGSSGAVCFQGEESLIFRAVYASGILGALTPPADQCMTWAPSGNLMLHRDSAAKVGFDSYLGPPGLGGEDVDFGLRYSRHGYKMVGTPGAVVCHSTATWNRLWLNVRRFFSWGRSDARLIQRHLDMSFIDVPSPLLVALFLFITTAFTSVLYPWAWTAWPIGVAVFVAVVMYGGARQAADDKPAGMFRYWVFFLLDIGRIFEACRSRTFTVIFRRFRYSSSQFDEEWPDLVLSLWATWLMLLFTIVFLWLTVTL